MQPIYVNEMVVERHHRFASSESQLILNPGGAYLVGDTTLLLSGPLRGHEGQKNRIKIPRRVNAAMSGL